MDAIGIIPARIGSTRLANKVLIDICGKPMLQHVWEGASKASLLDDVVIATDDVSVLEAAKGFGAKAVLTSRDHKSGTDRITEVVNPLDVKLVVNIQADEPLVHPSMINELVSVMASGPNIVMATIIKKITNEQELHDPNVVKVVLDREGFALYFSRAPVPYNREAASDKFLTGHHFKHIGIYVYTKDFLFTFTNMPPSKLESIEKLEQLRVLESGYRIKTVETSCETASVDTEADLEKVKNLLK